MKDHEAFMRLALAQAQLAFDAGEIPIGAVIVKDGQVVGRGYNSTEADKDPTCHAEIKAIRDAAKTLGGWRLPGCDMYVTTEPCAMCAGAIVLARIEHLYIGTMDPKAGACGSLRTIPNDPRLNHQAEIVTGVLQPECEQILKEFFRRLREKKKQEKKLTEESTQ
ncbi:MAG: nucleoside deaminase [Firmicutes bacterium]|nr:nucleoside deaminase [Bacillota bacterium]